MRKTKTPKAEKPAVVTAAQRIEKLEKSVDQLTQIAHYLNEKITALISANEAINKKMDAIVDVSEKLEDGEKVNKKVVEEYLVNQKMLDLKNKVDLLIESGVLIPTEYIDNDEIFVVGKEISKDGEIVSPRTQATVSSLNPEIKAAFMSKKVGDLIEFSEDKLSFMVDEIYAIKEPKQEEVVTQDGL